ncbi:MAG: protocatechuate 3,4-dioxygenase subunit alpha [Pseudomonadota bacterium]
MAGDRPLKESPSQTAGPYLHIGLMPEICGIDGIYRADPGAVMVNDDTLGERITVQGRIFDGNGDDVKDAVIEAWQADHAGRYQSGSEPSDPNFVGWGRQAVDPESGFITFQTIKPGRVRFDATRFQAPHISLFIIARGINIGLNTRLYFPESEENATDPVLALIDDAKRRDTLIAQKDGDLYTFNIHLQGEHETVFFDI